MANKTILFLGTTDRQRSRVAEVLFQHFAKQMGMPWQASSRGLVLDGKPGVDATLQKQLQLKRIALDALSRKPQEATALDLASATRIVALNRSEHEPLLRERFPEMADLGEKVEYWSIASGKEVVAPIETEVMALIARLLGGGAPPPPEPEPKKKPAPVLNKGLPIKVGRETAGRKGKGVTVLFDLKMSESEMDTLAGTLKKKCGTGGTVKDGRIEIQGDNRDRIITELETMGYKVKKAGG
jgi:translation initiation factor 1